MFFSKRVFEALAFFDAQKLRGRRGKRREENGLWVPRRPKTEEEEEEGAPKIPPACFVPKKKFRLLHAQNSTDGLSKKMFSPFPGRIMNLTVF